MPRRLLALLLVFATAFLPIAAVGQASGTAGRGTTGEAPVGCCGESCRCDDRCPCAARDEAPAETPAPPVAPTRHDGERLAVPLPTPATTLAPREISPRAPPAPGLEHAARARRPAGRRFRALSDSWHE